MEEKSRTNVSKLSVFHILYNERSKRFKVKSSNKYAFRDNLVRNYNNREPFFHN